MFYYPGWDRKTVLGMLLAIALLSLLALVIGLPGHTVIDPRWFRP